MKAAKVFVALVLLGVFVYPELRRYAGERELYRLTALARGAMQAPVAPERRGALLREVASQASSLAQRRPWDYRATMVAGGAYLVAGDNDLAFESYRAALPAGEHAEVDLNLARVLLRRGDPGARALLVRAGWISPALVGEMPKDEQPFVQEEIEKASKQLRAGLGSGIPGPPLAGGHVLE